MCFLFAANHLAGRATLTYVKILRAITMPYRTSVCVLVEARHVKPCLFQHPCRLEADVTFFYHGLSLLSYMVRSFICFL